MSDDDDTPRNARDFRLMLRTVAVVAVVVSAVIGALIAHFVHEERQDGKLENVEKWQQQKDREAARELWRRERAKGASQ